MCNFSDSKQHLWNHCKNDRHEQHLWNRIDTDINLSYQSYKTKRPMI